MQGTPRSPRPYQRPVLDWARSRDRIALFPEMRLGKTYMSREWATSKLRPGELALVIAPTPVIPVWEEELAIDGLAATTLYGSSPAKRLQLESGINAGCSWYIVNPEGLRAAPDLADYPWACVIIDESTTIANPQAKITKLMHKKFRNTRLKAVLSGNPAPEHDLQYFEQMRWLNGDFCGFKSYWEFRARCWHQAGFEWFPNRGVKAMYETELAKHCYVLSAKDAGIPDERIYERRYCDLNQTMRRLYHKINEEFAIGDLLTRWVPVAQTWLAQVAGGCLPAGFRESVGAAFTPHKFKELESLVRGELRGKPLVVFFRFNRELRLAARRLREMGIKLGVFTGWNKPHQRKRVVADFQAGRTQMLLAQGKAARFGQNFSRASAAIFFSNWWDWNTRSQLEARIRHPDRKEPALYIDLVTRGTVDEAAAKALREKARGSTALLQRIRELHGGCR